MRSECCAVLCVGLPQATERLVAEKGSVRSRFFYRDARHDLVTCLQRKAEVITGHSKPTSGAGAGACVAGQWHALSGLLNGR